MAVVLVAVLVVGIVAVWRHPSSRRVPFAPAPVGTPRRIVAVTKHHRLVVLDSRTGRTIRNLATDVGTFRGDPEVAASPDGSTVYFTAVDPARPTGCRTAGQESVFSVPVDGGRADVAARGRTVAVSSSGRIATSREHAVCTTGVGVLDVGPPVPRQLRAAGAELMLADTRWTDGGALTFNWARDGEGTNLPRGGEQPYALDLTTATTMDDARCVCGPAGAAIFGSFGRSDGFLGAAPSGATAQYAEDAVVLATDGSVRRTLFRWTAALQSMHSSPEGSVLFTSPTSRVGGRTFDALYRWSPGDRAPIRIRSGIIAAAWIPDPAPPRSAKAIAAIGGSGVPRNSVRMLDAQDGHELRRVDVGTEPLRAISADPGGSTAVVASGGTDASPCAGTMQRVDLSDGSETRILGDAAHPVVNGDGLIAYGINCDGTSLGFTERDGANYRADAVRDRSVRIAAVEVLSWSPNGRWLAYRVRVAGEPNWRYLAARIGITPRSVRMHRVALPSSSGVTALTFLDDTHVALVMPGGAEQAVVRRWRIGAKGSAASAPTIQHLGELPRALRGDATGRRTLAVLSDRIVWWRSGGGTRHEILGDVTDATWLPAG